MCSEYVGPWGTDGAVNLPSLELLPIKEMTLEEHSKYCQHMNELAAAGG